MTEGQELILIVDDEADIRDAVIRSNKLAHRSFKEAENGLEALTLLKEYPFNVIVCDITMPKMSGPQLLVIAREMGLETPFIFISGHAGSDVLSQIKDTGKVKFLEKTSIRGLSQTITQVISEETAQKSTR